MANGFITLENGEIFFTRWTGYDMILQIVTKELENLSDKEFADWLRTKFPNDSKEGNGGAQFHNSKDEMVIRDLDLRTLTKSRRENFWKALYEGAENLKKNGKAYSNINPERIEELLGMHSSKNTTDTPTEIHIVNPPDELDKAKVIKWAWSGKEPFGYIDAGDGSKIEIHGLAICQYEDSHSVYRFSCDENWEVQQDSLHDSVEDAVKQLPVQYQSVGVQWITVSC